MPMMIWTAIIIEAAIADWCAFAASCKPAFSGAAATAPGRFCADLCLFCPFGQARSLIARPRQRRSSEAAWHVKRRPPHPSRRPNFCVLLALQTINGLAGFHEDSKAGDAVAALKVCSLMPLSCLLPNAGAAAKSTRIQRLWRSLHTAYFAS